MTTDMSKFTMHLCGTVLVAILILPLAESQMDWSTWHNRVKRQDPWSPWRPPWYNFYPVVNVRLPLIGGWVEGRSVEWHIEDLDWESDYPGDEPPISEYPPWFMRRINCFMGVPYAEAPIGKLRFRRPQPAKWSLTWDAKYFRHACPQNLGELRKDIPDFPSQNVSEDCLYLNIFVPNITRIEDNMIIEDKTLYPVVVYFHGGRFLHGSAQQFPGHVLATREIVVVTVNYRLGALGFLSTEDEHGQGNWGMFDQQQALQFIKDNIKEFRGDPKQITIMGDEAGAVSVGMHMISPISRGKGFYQQAILMSGTDLSMFGFVEPYWRPREYARELAEILDCPTHHSYDMMECLRDNTTLSWYRFRDAQEQVRAKDGDLGVVWGPVQDGTAIFSQPTSFIFLPESPSDLRRQLLFEHVPTMIGLDSDAGAIKANETTKGLEFGIKESVFEDFVLELLTKWKIIENYRDRAWDAVGFQYTYWPDPTNDTARSLGFIDLITDLEIGTGMDTVIKLQADYMPNYVYEFKYKSWHDWVPKFMGTCGSAAVPYIFGFPFMNETVLNETEMLPRQFFDYDDRNMSDWMMYMWTNFIKYGEPNSNNTRNITWEPYSPQNLSYAVLDWHSHIWFRYRQDFYGFWKDYFPSLVRQDYLYPTATPTPAGYEYVIATGSMATIMILLLCGIGILIFLIWQQREQERLESAYRESEIPLNIFGHSQSMSSISRKSPAPEGSRSGALPYGGSEVGKVLESRSFEGGKSSGAQGYSGREYEERGKQYGERGYSERERGYPERERGYSERERGYPERERGYSERGYPEKGRWYEERERGRGHEPRGYEERGYGGRGSERGYEGRGREGRGYDPRGHNVSGYSTSSAAPLSGTTQHHSVV